MADPTITELALRMQTFEDRLDGDAKLNAERFDRISDDIGSIKDDNRIIKENHLAHIQKSMERMEYSSIKTTTDVGWLMKFFWIVVSASIGSLATGIFGLIKLANLAK